MAKKEKQQVEQTDPIVESVVEENFALQEETLEEGVETSEAVDWEIEAKKFQSMYDKKAAEHENLKRDSDDLIQLKNALSEKPELVDVIEKSLSGDSGSGMDHPRHSFRSRQRRDGRPFSRLRKLFCLPGPDSMHSGFYHRLRRPSSLRHRRRTTAPLPPG